MIIVKHFRSKDKSIFSFSWWVKRPKSNKKQIKQAIAAHEMQR